MVKGKRNLVIAAIVLLIIIIIAVYWWRKVKNTIKIVPLSGTTFLSPSSFAAGTSSSLTLAGTATGPAKKLAIPTNWVGKKLRISTASMGTYTATVSSASTVSGTTTIGTSAITFATARNYTPSASDNVRIYLS